MYQYGIAIINVPMRYCHYQCTNALLQLSMYQYGTTVIQKQRRSLTTTYTTTTTHTPQQTHQNTVLLQNAIPQLNTTSFSVSAACPQTPHAISASPPALREACSRPCSSSCLRTRSCSGRDPTSPCTCTRSTSPSYLASLPNSYADRSIGNTSDGTLLAFFRTKSALN